MSCKKKEQSSCTSAQMRVLESLSIKDIARAEANYLANPLNSRKGSLTSRKDSLTSRKGSLTSRKGSLSSQKGSISSRKDSLSPSVFGQNACDPDDCNLVYRTSQWNGSISPSVSDQYVCGRDDCNQALHLTTYRNSSVSPSLSSEHISNRDDCQVGIYRSSHHQWPGSSGSRPPSRKQSKTCLPLCAEVSAVLDGIQHCRDAIGTLAQEAQNIINAASGLLDDCGCDNKSDQIRKKTHKKVKNVGSCCRNILETMGSSKETCSVSSWLGDCVCDKAEIEHRKISLIKTTASKQSCQKICENNSNHKITASDCACNEKKKKCKKAKVESKTSFQKKCSRKQRPCRVCNTLKELEDCTYDDGKKKQQMKVKNSSSSCNCRKQIKKKTSDKNTCYQPPVVVEKDKEMKKRNEKLKIGEKCSDKNTCYVPQITADHSSCVADMIKRIKKERNTDSQNCCKKAEKTDSDNNNCCIPSVDEEICKACCQKTVPKKNSVNDTCCDRIVPEDHDDCVFEGDKKKQNNNANNMSERKPCCPKVSRKKTSDKGSGCVKPVVNNDWTCEGAEKKMQWAEKDNLASSAMSCGIPSCAENVCTCCFPPAYKLNFKCTGQISGSCQCDK